MATSPHPEAPAPPSLPERDDAPSPIHILPVAGLGEIRHGDDLAALLVPVLERAGLADGDVVCLAGKIVSKAAGLVIPPERKREAVREQAVRTVARRRHGEVVTEVVQLAHGPVMAAAGIDASNAPDGLLLLPPDPDASARALHREITRRTGRRIAVIVTDTSSRVWRQGVTDLALGAAGLRSLQDLRGSADGSGRRLSITVRDLADEIAAASDLVKGKATGVPVAIVRGLADALAADPAEEIPASALSRTGHDDWFRRPSLESVWQALGLSVEQEPIAAMAPEPVAERVQRAIIVAAPSDDLRAQVHEESTATGVMLHVRPLGRRPEDLVQAGRLAERLCTAVRAEAIADDHPGLLSVQVDVEIPQEDPR